MISDALWRTRFGRYPKILGKSVRLDGTDYRIVGVTRPGFEFPSRDTRIWLPLAPTPKEAADHHMHDHVALARLRQGEHRTRQREYRHRPVCMEVGDLL